MYKSNETQQISTLQLINANSKRKAYILVVVVNLKFSFLFLKDFISFARF